MVNTDSRSFYRRHQFVIRRIHSLLGLVPIGAYMCIHLLTNASILESPQRFQERVDMIHQLGAFLPFVEWGFIFLPLIFHGVLGIFLVAEGDRNTSAYPLSGNVRYALQRWTGMIAFVFIAYHVFEMHGWIRPVAERFGGAKFDPHYAAGTAAAAIQAGLIIQVAYAIGILAAVFHLANGIWSAGITWGVWTSQRAQQQALYVCAAFGVLLAVVGLGALYGMATLDLSELRMPTQAEVHGTDEPVEAQPVSPDSPQDHQARLFPEAPTFHHLTATSVSTTPLLSART